LPGQFPGEELYNLDIRDELRWMIEAKRKQLLRDMSQLQMVNLAMAGGQKAKEMYDNLLNEYSALEGIDRRREQIEANWASLKMIGRG